jgi:hypothetical protein
MDVLLKLKNRNSGGENQSVHEDSRLHYQWQETRRLDAQAAL